MVDIPINELRSMSYASIEGLISRCREELNRRDQEERDKLIANFKKAYNALREAGVDITYDDEYEYDNTAILNDWDAFSFN